MNGAYHATPWGKHVNEGIPEWPPSPWRLLRAIISSWKNTKSELKDENIWPILQKLAGELPVFKLPDASVSHTRHYMPTSSKKTLIINTFVVTGNKPLYILWNNVTFSQQEIELLQSILKNLHYFGRAESWCTISISTEHHDNYNCVPLEDQENVSDGELVRVLVPNQNVDFVDLSNPQLDEDNLKSISITTAVLQNKNYIDPPGGKWVQYIRPQNCFEEKTYPKNNTSMLDNITLVRYAVVGTIRPHIKDTLRVGDLARNACMSKYGKIKNGDTSTIFSGKDGKGKPLLNHTHAFYLSTYETQHDEIDHFTIFAPSGFNKEELEALFCLKRLYRYNTTDVNLLFQGCGNKNIFSDVPIFKKSCKWISATPLILTRHVHYKGKKNDRRIRANGPEEQIRNELMNRYGKEYSIKNIKIDGGQTNIDNTTTKPSDFFRWRKHGSIGDGTTYKVELEFEEKVTGPITLGYASHFGLGMFVPQGNT